MVFLPLSAFYANFLSLIKRKAGSFLDEKRLKPLYINAFMIIQQAPIIYQKKGVAQSGMIKSKSRYSSLQRFSVE
ncbi:MAG: hypothetical protein F6K22_25565 [Okeania sp. SIO2F4]|uniref:hypothetical protein n=1 Tax=Okeania sp. SIO2F4 TaxID=2607790 RepID=UPI00142C57DC|nr:hypothetical protein [Okeania sp. SIO2F4]MDJ0517897.1 hypothetical protein [Trichodesmium sp. MO_231.B1]NES05877.1 hypothetical protein [Okeania sp. SIO2F4]